MVKSCAPKAKILSIMKADAYGHGAAVCLPPLETHSDALGVACLEEAEELRALGATKPIVLMEGCFSKAAVDWCGKNNIQPVVHRVEQLAFLEAPMAIWIEVDTGLHRLGLLPEEVKDALKWLKKNPQITVICWFSHFSDAEAELNSKSRIQMARFEEACGGIVGDKGLAQSTATLHLPQTHYQWVRPGLMLYGVSPLAGKTGADFGLKPVMTLTAPLIAKRSLKAQESVGYGSTWVTGEAGATIGTVAMGYGDGYPWRITPNTLVEIEGKKVPIVGRVSMDSMMIDLTAYPEVALGSQATLWGPSLPVEILAEQLGVIPYVLVTGLTKRVKRG
jgi:alanine racemase